LQLQADFACRSASFTSIDCHHFRSRYWLPAATALPQAQLMLLPLLPLVQQVGQPRGQVRDPTRTPAHHTTKYHQRCESPLMT
jgi:hypothetical protein